MHCRETFNQRCGIAVRYRWHVHNAIVLKAGPDCDQWLEPFSIRQLPQTLESIHNIITSNRIFVPTDRIRLRAEVKQIQPNTGKPEQMRSVKQPLHQRGALSCLAQRERLAVEVIEVVLNEQDDDHIWIKGQPLRFQ